MKKILLLIFLITSLSGLSQTKTKTVQKKQNYKPKINSDTTYILPYGIYYTVDEKGRVDTLMTMDTLVIYKKKIIDIKPSH